MSDANVEARFSIGELSRRTQVNTVTLRAWERRYGLLRPTRTAKGHRLYGDTDVQRVQDILAWIGRGVPVSKVRELLAGEQPNGQSAKASGIESAREAAAIADSHWGAIIERLVDASQSLRPDRTQAVLQETLGQYPAAQASHFCLEPSLQQLAAQRPARFILQSEIMRYAVMRLARQSGSDPQMLLLFGEGSEGWRLAVAALRLADAGYSVSLLNQPCAVTTWCALAQQSHDIVVVLQDGQLAAADISAVQQLMRAGDNVRLCGSAGVLALPEQASSGQLFSSLEALLEQYLPTA